MLSAYLDYLLEAPAVVARRAGIVQCLVAAKAAALAFCPGMLATPPLASMDSAVIVASWPVVGLPWPSVTNPATWLASSALVAPPMAPYPAPDASHVGDGPQP